MAFRKNVTMRVQIATRIAQIFHAGFIDLMSGPQPASANMPTTGILLCKISLPNPAFTTGDVVISRIGTWSGVAQNTGVAGYARFVGGAGVFDVSVGESGSGADVIIDNVNIAAGTTVTVVSFSIIEEGG